MNTGLNKPKKHKSLIIQKLQKTRSVAEFEKTKKSMLLAAKKQKICKPVTIILNGKTQD